MLTPTPPSTAATAEAVLAAARSHAVAPLPPQGKAARLVKPGEHPPPPPPSAGAAQVKPGERPPLHHLVLGLGTGGGVAETEKCNCNAALVEVWGAPLRPPFSVALSEALGPPPPFSAGAVAVLPMLHGVMGWGGSKHCAH
eukprot:1148208-Pelagomonas_calceolata.AAC.3